MDGALNRSWEWNHQDNRYEGVHTFGGQLLWYLQTSPDWAGSAAREQTFEEFLAEGAPVSCPKEIQEEIRAFLPLHLVGLYEKS